MLIPRFAEHVGDPGVSKIKERTKAREVVCRRQDSKRYRQNYKISQRPPVFSQPLLGPGDERTIVAGQRLCQKIKINRQSEDEFGSIAESQGKKCTCGKRTWAD